MPRRLPLEILDLVCAELSAAGALRTLATFLRSGRDGYAIAAPHLYASLIISRGTFPALMAGLTFRQQGKSGWDLVPLSKGAVYPYLIPCRGTSNEWPNAESRKRKLALLARCITLTVEGYPDLDLFDYICVNDWQGCAATSEQETLFPRVHTVELVANSLHAELPGGMPLSALGLYHPMLGLLATLRPLHVSIRLAEGDKSTAESGLRDFNILRNRWRPVTFTIMENHMADCDGSAKKGDRHTSLHVSSHCAPLEGGTVSIKASESRQRDTMDDLSVS